MENGLWKWGEEERVVFVWVIWGGNVGVWMYFLFVEVVGGREMIDRFLVRYLLE